jgi:hypothetical protein
VNFVTHAVRSYADLRRNHEQALAGDSGRDTDAAPATLTPKEKSRLNKRFATLLVGLLGGLLPHPGYSQQGPSIQPGPEVRAFIVDMHEQHGFDIAHLTRQFASIRPNTVVLRAIRPAAVPEQQRSWQRYRERFLTSTRVDGGRAFGKDMRSICSAPQRPMAFRPKSSLPSSYFPQLKEQELLQTECW